MQKTWQDLLKEVITDPAVLLRELHLSLDWLPAARRVAQLFPLRVPHGFIARMRKSDPYDPLLRQVLPLAEEEKKVRGFSEDPLRERDVNPLPGLLQKYQGRVLLSVASACAIHCRYCFRRHFSYQKNILHKQAWEAILSYIDRDPSLYEVILSGGDPLLANDAYLEKKAHELAAIKHLKILRIHSRLPIVLPQRITEEFAHWFSATRLNPILVIHCNHANELDEHVRIAVDILRRKRIPVLNQAVLLRGVNDSLEALTHLSLRLFESGVLPYYLHRLDKVQGAAHFAVDEDKVKDLLNKLRKQLSGYLIPRYVYEQAGSPSKLPWV